MPTRSSRITALETAFQNWLEDVVRRVVREELGRSHAPPPRALAAETVAERTLTDAEEASAAAAATRLITQMHEDDAKRCSSCDHMPIVHANRKGRCRAKSCSCRRWVAKAPAPSSL